MALGHPVPTFSQREKGLIALSLWVRVAVSWIADASNAWALTKRLFFLNLL